MDYLDDTHRKPFPVAFYGRRVVIILEIDVIKRAEEVAGRIGDPTPYTESKTLSFGYGFKRVKEMVNLGCLEVNGVKSLGQTKTQPTTSSHDSRPPLQPQNRNESKWWG